MVKNCRKYSFYKIDHNSNTTEAIVRKFQSAHFHYKTNSLSFNSSRALVLSNLGVRAKYLNAADDNSSKFAKSQKSVMQNRHICGRIVVQTHSAWQNILQNNFDTFLAGFYSKNLKICSFFFFFKKRKM